MVNNPPLSEQMDEVKQTYVAQKAADGLGYTIVEFFTYILLHVGMPPVAGEGEETDISQLEKRMLWNMKFNSFMTDLRKGRLMSVLTGVDYLFIRQAYVRWAARQRANKRREDIKKKVITATGAQGHGGT